MTAIPHNSIASCIRVVLDAAWWLVAVTLTLFTGLLVFSFFANVEGGNLTMDLPVALELEPPVRSDSASLDAGAQIEKLRANLRFPVRNGAFFSATVFLIALLLGGLLWTLTQLRLIFQSVRRGLVFLPENIRRIRWVGFTLILGELARAAVVYFWSYYTSLHFTANGLRFVASTDFSGLMIVAGLAVLGLAEVFREGTRLHEDQSLTI